MIERVYFAYQKRKSSSIYLRGDNEITKKKKDEYHALLCFPFFSIFSCSFNIKEEKKEKETTLVFFQWDEHLSVSVRIFFCFLFACRGLTISLLIPIKCCMTYRLSCIFISLSFWCDRLFCKFYIWIVCVPLSVYCEATTKERKCEKKTEEKCQKLFSMMCHRLLPFSIFSFLLLYDYSTRGDDIDNLSVFFR